MRRTAIKRKGGQGRPPPESLIAAVLSLPDGSSRGCHKNTASEIRFIGEKAVQQVQVVMPIESLYVWTTTRARAGNDIGKPVAVHITRGYTNTAGEGRIKRKEAQQDRVRGPVKDFHVWTTTRTGAGNDVGKPVAVHVAGSYINSAGKVCIVGKETLQYVQVHSVKDFHVRPAAWTRGGTDVDAPIFVTVTVAHC